MCNVLLISLDTLRPDHLGAYGYARNTSPHIDQIAAEGIVFRNAFTPSPWTLPAHFSILTGLYPSRHQVLHTRSRLSPDVPTFAELFQNHGYRTGAFTGGGYLEEYWGFRGFDTFVSKEAGMLAPWPEVRASAQRASEWMTSVEEPFFAFWHTYAPHAPYVPDEGFDKFTDPSYSGVVDLVPGRNVEICGEDPHEACITKQAQYFSRLRELGLLDEADRKHMIASYDGVIRSIDEVLGSVWRSLEESGRLGRTIVVITSDHGETFPQIDTKRPFGHPNPYRSNVWVPWVLWAPGGGAREVTDVVEILDIMPTVTGLVGIPSPPDLDGRDRFAAGDSNPRGLAVTEYWSVQEGELVALSFVWRNWHYIRWYDERKTTMQLFDMEADPEELNDLISVETRAQARMERLTERWMEAIASRGAQAPEEGELDPALLEQLRALGYL